MSTIEKKIDLSLDDLMKSNRPAKAAPAAKKAAPKGKGKAAAGGKKAPAKSKPPPKGGKASASKRKADAKKQGTVKAVTNAQSMKRKERLNQKRNQSNAKRAASGQQVLQKPITTGQKVTPALLKKMERLIRAKVMKEVEAKAKPGARGKAKAKAAKGKQQQQSKKKAVPVRQKVVRPADIKISFNTGNKNAKAVARKPAAKKPVAKKSAAKNNNASKGGKTAARGAGRTGGKGGKQTQQRRRVVVG